VSCYERRWQIETRYHEFKQSVLGMQAATLRSQTVEGVYQEFWGALIAYNHTSGDGQSRAHSWIRPR
jgi:hypothetical protein